MFLSLRTILAERLDPALRPASGGLPLLAFCGGVGALQWQSVLPDAQWLAILLVALALVAGGLHAFSPADRAGFARALPLGRAVAGLACACLLGFGWAAWRAEVRLADQLPADWERRDISLVGVVAELPRELERGRRFVFEVEQVATPGAVVPRKILLSWFSGSHEDQTLADRVVQPGERWRFTVRLKKPHGNANPGGFDYEGWLLERGLRATGYVRAKPAAERLGEVWSLATAIEGLRAELRRRLQAKLGEAPYGGVVVALALGDQGSIASEHWRIFAATGTTHLMSISGLHVTMLAALFGGFANWLWRRWPRGMLALPAQRVAILCGWLAALAYTLLAGAGIPAVRTLLMLGVAALAHTLDRRVGAPRILLLALFAVLLVDPWAVLVVGFWLSFAAVGLLLFFAQDAEPAEPVPGQAAVSRRAAAFRGVRHWAWAQWVVTLGSVPLVLTLFQAISLASPLANALAIPLIGFLVAPLSVAAALLPLPWLAELAHQLLALLMLPLDALAAQPWALWRQATPAGWTVALAVAGVLLHLVVQAWRWRLAALLLVLPIFLSPPVRPRQGEAWLDLFDVGQGLAVLVRTAERNLLFDAGPRYSPELSAGERLVLPALRALGVARLDGVVISHQDHDHAGGAAAVLGELPVGWVASSVGAAHALAAAWPLAPRPCLAGQQFAWDGVAFRFLSPPESYYAQAGINSNRLSCVLRIEAAGKVALLTGDAELAEERQLLAAGEPGAIDVLQVAHHGSRSASGAAFVAAAAPKWALFAVGYRNPFAHPHPEVWQRFGAQGAERRRTDRDGAIHVELGEEIRVATRRQASPRYWDGR